MHPGEIVPHGRRCHHCGRPVCGTTHTRTSYHVDHYAIHGGGTEPAVIIDPEDGVETMILRLVHPMDYFTCSDCYAKEAVRRERDRLFRPERAEETDTE